jgi:hypothetical protein
MCNIPHGRPTGDDIAQLAKSLPYRPGALSRGGRGDRPDRGRDHDPHGRLAGQLPDPGAANL